VFVINAQEPKLNRVLSSVRGVLQATTVGKWLSKSFQLIGYPNEQERLNFFVDDRFYYWTRLGLAILTLPRKPISIKVVVIRIILPPLTFLESNEEKNVVLEWNNPRPVS
jgi:hypothetical protein